MINTVYLERAADDLKSRIGSLLVNNETIPILSVTRNGSQVVVATDNRKGITHVTSLKLLDDQGNVITDRLPNINVADQQRLIFRFEFNVRSGSL